MNPRNQTLYCRLPTDTPAIHAAGVTVSINGSIYHLACQHEAVDLSTLRIRAHFPSILSVTINSTDHMIA